MRPPLAPPPPVVQLPPQLTDPATGDKLANVDAGAVAAHSSTCPSARSRPRSRAGRRLQPTGSLTVRELARRDDPNFDRNLERRIAEARPKIQASMRALATALPQVMQGLRQAREAIERAAANMPDPNYPKR